MEKGYQVIARRWRPQQFDELVGQDHIVRTLKNAIESNRIAHAYLFVGPRGTGKTSAARIFAKALNAAGGPHVHPDNESEIAKAIMSGNCLDVIEIDAASNTGVDNVRELRENCQYAPAQCTYKIYIIDEVHMLSTGAFNALLKTLEEPPPHVKFIFATTEAQKLLATIVSRCQRFEFRPISTDVLQERLKLICDTEGIQADPEALAAIARMANGGMRDAQSILDQMISFCGIQISEPDVLSVYGMASAVEIQKLAVALATADYPIILQKVEQFASEGLDLFRILLDLQECLRGALLDAVQHEGKTETLGIELSAESLMRMLDMLKSGEVSVQKGLSDRVNFEVVLLKTVEAGRQKALDTLIRKLSDCARMASDSEKKKPLNLS
jgi:DNA polymerase-3 subunit gamma/tau